MDNNTIMIPIKLQKTEKLKDKTKKYSDDISLKLSQKQEIMKPKKIATNQEILFMEQGNKNRGEYKTMKTKEIEEAALNIFLNLKDKNYAIKYSIQKWRNQAFGVDQKHLNYNYLNLYTKKQIEQIEQKLQSKKDQNIIKKSCEDPNQLRQCWDQLIKNENEKQHQVRKEKLKRINPNLNFIIHLKMHNHKAPIQVLELENKNLNVNQQKNQHVLDKNILKQQIPTPIKNVRTHLESIKPSPSITLKRNIKEDKIFFQVTQKKDKSKIPKFKSDIVLPSLHKRNIFCQSKPNDEQQYIRKIEYNMIEKPNNYSSKSDRLCSHIKQLLRYESTNKKKQLAKIKNLEKISNISLNLINAYNSNGK